jgi:hypothetical protein
MSVIGLLDSVVCGRGLPASSPFLGAGHNSVLSAGLSGLGGFNDRLATGGLSGLNDRLGTGGLRGPGLNERLSGGLLRGGLGDRLSGGSGGLLSDRLSSASGGLLSDRYSIGGSGGLSDGLSSGLGVQTSGPGTGRSPLVSPHPPSSSLTAAPTLAEMICRNKFLEGKSAVFIKAVEGKLSICLSV